MRLEADTVLTSGKTARCFERGRSRFSQVRKYQLSHFSTEASCCIYFEQCCTYVILHAAFSDFLGLRDFSRHSCCQYKYVGATLVRVPAISECIAALRNLVHWLQFSVMFKFPSITQ